MSHHQPTAARIGDIRQIHMEHVRVGWRCDCVLDLLNTLDYAVEELREMDDPAYGNERAGRLADYLEGKADAN